MRGLCEPAQSAALSDRWPQAVASGALCARVVQDNLIFLVLKLQDNLDRPVQQSQSPDDRSEYICARDRSIDAAVNRVLSVVAQQKELVFPALERLLSAL